MTTTHGTRYAPRPAAEPARENPAAPGRTPAAIHPGMTTLQQPTRCEATQVTRRSRTGRIVILTRSTSRSPAPGTPTPRTAATSSPNRGAPSPNRGERAQGRSFPLPAHEAAGARSYAEATGQPYQDSRCDDPDQGRASRRAHRGQGRTSMEHRAREYLWTTGNALFSTPRGMSPASYPVLLHLPGRQEPGGRCPVTPARHHDQDPHHPRSGLCQ